MGDPRGTGSLFCSLDEDRATGFEVVLPLRDQVRLRPRAEVQLEGPLGPQEDLCYVGLPCATELALPHRVAGLGLCLGR